MARPKKSGLDYFPLDVDFFDDEKIEAISGEFGIKGEISAIKLLCAIYRNGYYILWSEMLKMKLLKSLPSISPELLDTIVHRLVTYEFFDKNLFDSSSVLTSRGIQNRFFEAIKRRNNEEDLPYLLVNVDNKRVNVDNNPAARELMYTLTPQSKVKKSKEEKKEKEKEKEIFSEVALIDPNPVIEGGDPKLPFNECLIEALSDQKWVEVVCMQNRIRSIEALKPLFNRFEESLIANGHDLNKTVRDFKRHFSNWIKKTQPLIADSTNKPSLKIV